MNEKRYVIHITMHEMDNGSTEKFGRTESGAIRSGGPNRNYDAGWDRIFGKKDASVN